MSQWLPIAEIAQKVRIGELKATDLVEQALDTIRAKQEYKAIIVTTDKRALRRAKDLDASITNGESAGRLSGVPFIAKDNFLTLESETTAASNILKGFEAPYQATAIERLEAQGAICVAKANLDAFAHGASTENSDFFTTHNPHDKTRVPGGSSGGPAAAVMLDIAPFAIGTDTGGSIRQPACFCGVIGYKPTYGLVSRSGVVAMASSTDTIGPLTRTVADAALVLDVMAGKDSLDSTTTERDIKGYSEIPSTEYRIQNTKVGVVKEYMGEGVDDGVRKQIDRAIQILKGNGAKVSEVSLPSLPLALAAYYIIVLAEISSNLSRYDGQRYGYSFPDAKDVEESFSASRSIGLGTEAKRRIMIGTYVLSSGYYDAYYRKAAAMHTKLINEFNSAFEKYDFLIGPVAPTTAFKIGQNVQNPLSMYLADIMTVSASLVGLPAISIPAGASGGMPVGLQVMAAQNSDRHLLEFAAILEKLL